MAYWFVVRLESIYKCGVKWCVLVRGGRCFLRGPGWEDEERGEGCTESGTNLSLGCFSRCVWLDAGVMGGGFVASYMEFKGLFSVAVVAVEDFWQEKTDVNKVLHENIGVNYNLFY